MSPLLMPGYGEGIAPRVLADISASLPLIVDTSGAAPGTFSLSGDPPYPYLAPLYDFIHGNYEVVGHLPGKDWTVWSPK